MNYIEHFNFLNVIIFEIKQAVISAASNIVEQFTSSIDIKLLNNENTYQALSAISSASNCEYVSGSTSSNRSQKES